MSERARLRRLRQTNRELDLGQACQRKNVNLLSRDAADCRYDRVVHTLVLAEESCSIKEGAAFGHLARKTTAAILLPSTAPSSAQTLLRHDQTQGPRPITRRRPSREPSPDQAVPYLQAIRLGDFEYAVRSTLSQGHNVVHERVGSRLNRDPLNEPALSG